MRNRRQLFLRLLRRILFLMWMQIVGVTAANLLIVVVTLMWLVGFILLPVAIIRSTRDEGEPVLPSWAYWWDDTEDASVRGRPAAQFVWQYNVGWPVATFLWLQFYNPLANARAWFRRRTGQ